MHRTAPNETAASARSAPGTMLHRVFLILFLLQYLFVWLRIWFPGTAPAHAYWPEALLLMFATATTLASLSRQLPAQNVLLAAVVIAFVAGIAQAFGALTGIPGYSYSAQLGPKIFRTLPWAVPLLWIVILLNARGVGRLLLRRWRHSEVYGFWLIGLAILLAVLFDLGLEPFATAMQNYWAWSAAPADCEWYKTPCIHFLGWGVIALAALVLATPSLINKRPVASPPQFHPLLIWLLLNALFLTAAAVHRSWPIVLLESAHCLLVLMCSVYELWMDPERRKNAP